MGGSAAYITTYGSTRPKKVTRRKVSNTIGKLSLSANYIIPEKCRQFCSVAFLCLNIQTATHIPNGKGMSKLTRHMVNLKTAAAVASAKIKCCLSKLALLTLRLESIEIAPRGKHDQLNDEKHDKSILDRNVFPEIYR